MLALSLERLLYWEKKKWIFTLYTARIQCLYAGNATPVLDVILRFKWQTHRQTLSTWQLLKMFADEDTESVSFKYLKWVFATLISYCGASAFCRPPTEQQNRSCPKELTYPLPYTVPWGGLTAAQVFCVNAHNRLNAFITKVINSIILQGSFFFFFVCYSKYIY